MDETGNSIPLRGRRAAAIAFCAFLVSLPFQRLTVPVGGVPVFPSDLLLGITYLLALPAILRAPPRVGLPLVASLAFLGALAASLLLGEPPGIGRILKLAGFAAFVLLPVLSIGIVRTREELALAARSWMLGATVAAMIGLAGIVAFYLDRQGSGAELMCGWGGLPELPVPRLCAPFNNPNMFATYLVASSALAAGAGRVLAGRWAQMLLGAAALVTLFTLSAGVGGFALAVTMVWLAPDPAGRPARWLRRLAVAATAIAVLGASAIMLVSPGVGADGSLELTPATRISIWRDTLPSLAKAPWLGRGYGLPVSFTQDPRAYRHGRAFDRQGEEGAGVWLEGHNVWVNVAGQSGVVGLAFFALLCLTHAVQLVRRKPVDPLLAALRTSVLAGAAGVLLFNGLWAAVEEARFLWALLALGSIAVHLSGQETGVAAI